MRIAGLLTIALLATTADAATQKAPQPPAPAAGLRGPVTAMAKPAPMSLISALSDPAGATASATADNAECRRVCSHAYFFCLQTEGAGDCPQGWSTCLSDCNRPSFLLRRRSE